MAMHRPNPQLHRGKRRGDCQEFADLGYHNGNSSDFNSNGKDVPVFIAEAKRRCLEPTPFAEWNSVPNIVSNGYHHLQHKDEPCLSHTDMQKGLPDAHMDFSMEQLHGAITANGHANGSEHNHHNNNFHHQQGGQQIDLNGGGEPASATPVISNGYYGYIANYEHTGGDVEEDSMDTGLTVQAEYAIDGPSSCIEPKERRVCVRCSAGEPGHITHIMQL